jgi:hypothetical protein
VGGAWRQYGGEYELMQDWRGKTSSKAQLTRSRLRRENNIKADLKEMGWESVDWTNLDQDMGKTRAVVYTVTNHRVP